MYSTRYTEHNTKINIECPQKMSLRQSTQFSRDSKEHFNLGLHIIQSNNGISHDMNYEHLNMKYNRVSSVPHHTGHNTHNNNIKVSELLEVGTSRVNKRLVQVQHNDVL